MRNFGNGTRSDMIYAKAHPEEFRAWRQQQQQQRQNEISEIQTQETTMATTVKAPGDLGKLKDLKVKAAEIKRRMDVISADYKSKLKALQEADAAELERYTDPDMRRVVAETQKKRMAQATAELRKQTQEARNKLAAEAALLSKNVKETEAFLADPRRQASVFELGSEARDRMAREVEKAGPAALRDFMLRARLSDDLVLAAALVTEIGRMSVKDREKSGIDLDGFSRDLFGHMTAPVKELASSIYQDTQSAQNLNREINGVSASPLEILQSGLDNPGKRLTPSPVRKPLSVGNSDRSMERLNKLEAASLKQ